MPEITQLTQYIESTEARIRFEQLTGDLADQQPERYQKLLEEFAVKFGDQRDCMLFSAPGRIEIGGNHTDHNHGRVLAAAVTLDMAAIASRRGDTVITLWSQGYDRPFVVDIADQSVREEEKGTTEGILRGMAVAFMRSGYRVMGFDAVMHGNVLPGSGLSSSAAVEMLIATIFEHLNGITVLTPVEKARMGLFAENEYFGKPSGLMDQTASAVGGLVGIDFEREQPVVEALQYDFANQGYTMAVINTGGDHAELIGAYAAITDEMRMVAQHLGYEKLRHVPYGQFDAALPGLIKKLPHRAVLRAAHFFAENDRVPMQIAALRSDQMDIFLSLMRQSGWSSYRWLQNCYLEGGREQPIAIALWLSENLLGNLGAYRVHGGGFAGTILAFVPDDLLENYCVTMRDIFGDNAVTLLQVRPLGAVRVDA